MQQETQSNQPMPMLLELFGHNRIAGYVSEHSFAGASFVRVDVPAVADVPGLTRMFHPNAVYCFNPVDEETMLDMADRLRIKPLTPFDLSEIRRKLVASLPDSGSDPLEGVDFDDDNEPGEEDDQKW